MIGVDTLLGLGLLKQHKENKENKNYSHCIIKTVSSRYTKVAAPCIVDSYMLNKANIREIQTLLPFPVHIDIQPRQIYPINKEYLIQRDSKSYANTTEIVSIDKMDATEIEKLIAHANGSGAVCARTDIIGATGFLNNIDYLLDRYKYHSVLRWHYTPWAKLHDYGVKNEEVVAPYVTMFDISHCVPIFNTKKVDGIGIMYETILEKHTESVGGILNSSSLIMIFSQFSDNVFYLDGTAIGTPNVLRRDLLDNLRLAIIDLEKREAEKTKKEKKKVFRRRSKKKEEKRENTVDNNSTIGNSTYGFFDESDIADTDGSNSHFDSDRYYRMKRY